MKYIDYNNPNYKVHFIGIGGISMSSLAKILLNKGFKISGSDERPSPIIDNLINKGVEIYLGHKSENIDDDVDLVVYTAAIKDDNCELICAKTKNIITIDRATLLGDIMLNYTYSIGVSGTHGKTTTTSMVSHILLEANTDPTITVGGILDAINGNTRIGSSQYFITEACEYCNSFLKFNPFIGVILNIEEDHLDFFKDINQIRDSFKKYAENLPSDGHLIINSSIDNHATLTKDLKCNILTVGIEDEKSHLYAKNLTYVDNIYPNFDVYYKNLFLGNITLSVPGLHNAFNAMCAIAVGHVLNIDFQHIKNGLESFKGAKKRFEYKGNIKGVTVIHDYAHHPSEIKATLETAKNMPHNKLWCVFQPHTYTRTKLFLEEFSTSFNHADKIILADIYAAREKNNYGIHSKDLLDLMVNKGYDVTYFETFDEIENFLLENCSPDDLLITMGAGDIEIVANEMLGQ